MLVEVSQVDQIYYSGFWMRPVQVLHGVSLSVRPKSVFGFLGANGAGKTTLIQLLVGLRRPKAGTIRVCGHAADSVEARSRLGYLPERPYFQEHLTGEGLLRYYGALSGLDRARIDKRIPEALAVVGLERARKIELRRYSKGMLQRIGIAQAILHEPELLVLDEPMSGLDPFGRREIRDLIRSLAQAGHTVFFSSHVIPDVEAVCDEVAFIEKGRIGHHGKIGELLSLGRTRIEIGLAGLAVEEARKIGFLEEVLEMPDGLRAMVADQESLQKALEALLKRKARVLWVNPQRPSLETLL
jgi:ABC-2 type transport system ATP-binding protein